MSNNSSERVPLLAEQQVADGDEEASPNYSRSSRRRVLRDWLVVIALVVFCGIVIAILSIEKPVQDSSLLEDIRKLYHAPALAAGVLRNGSFDIEVTGVRKYDDNVTMARENDLWHLASNTKAITATLLALLIEDGLLTWETTLAEALPAWKENMSDGHKNTTLAMVGAHHGGFSETWVSQGELLNSLWNFTSSEGRGVIAQHSFTQEPIFKPGTQFEYSNTGYILLGYLMEQITGESWEDMVVSRIFEPLSMDECRIGISLDTIIPPTSPWPHRLLNSSEIIPVAPDKYGDLPLVFNSAGGVYCSLSSYSKFLNFHLDGSHRRRSPNLNITLSDVSFERLHDPWPGKNRYSSGGWGTSYITGAGRVLMHSGSNQLDYFRAVIAPEVEGAFVAATNIGFAENATNEVIRAMVDGRLLE